MDTSAANGSKASSPPPPYTEFANQQPTNNGTTTPSQKGEPLEGGATSAQPRVNPPTQPKPGLTGKTPPVIEHLETMPRDKQGKRGHIVPRSHATSARDRWEILYIYVFIRKFTKLINNVPGFFTCEDLERGIMDDSGTPDPMMEEIFRCFIRNLKPQTRNLSSALLPQTISTFLSEGPVQTLHGVREHKERGVFWDEPSQSNLNPLKELEGGFWKASWDLKLKILRQFVDWQLSHSQMLRETLDTAWSARQKAHKKQAEPPKPPPAPQDPQSKENLMFLPFGHDKLRTRYWVIDDSPWMWTSTNPWKVTSTFVCVSSTLDEYVECIDKLRETAPPEIEEDEPQKRLKAEIAHWDLIYALEARVDTVEAELRRVAEARIQQAQAPIIQTLEDDIKSEASKLGSRLGEEDAFHTAAEDSPDQSKEESETDDDDEEIDELADDDEDAYETAQAIKTHALYNLPRGKINGNGISKLKGTGSRQRKVAVELEPQPPLTASEPDRSSSITGTIPDINVKTKTNTSSRKSGVKRRRQTTPTSSDYDEETDDYAGAQSLKRNQVERVSKRPKRSSLGTRGPTQTSAPIPDQKPAGDEKVGKGKKGKRAAKFWYYADVDEDALPKDLPDPEAALRKRRKSVKDIGNNAYGDINQNGKASRKSILANDTDEGSASQGRAVGGSEIGSVED